MEPPKNQRVSLLHLSHVIIYSRVYRIQRKRAYSLSGGEGGFRSKLVSKLHYANPKALRIHHWICNSACAKEDSPPSRLMYRWMGNALNVCWLRWWILFRGIIETISKSEAFSYNPLSQLVSCSPPIILNKGFVRTLPYFKLRHWKNLCTFNFNKGCFHSFTGAFTCAECCMCCVLHFSQIRRAMGNSSPRTSLLITELCLL